MTANRFSAAQPDDDPRTATLARFHSVLPELALLARAEGLEVGPARWQNIYDLLIALAARGRLPEHACALEPLILPLLARSAAEQHQLRLLIARWLEMLPRDLSGLHIEDDQSDAPSQDSAPAPTPRPYPWLWGLALVLVLTIVGIYGYQLKGQEDESTPTRPPTAVPTPEAQPELPADADDDTEPGPATASAAIQPRRPFLEPRLDAERRALLQTLEMTAMILPPFMVAAWLLVQWLGLQLVLERRRGNPRDPLTNIALCTAGDDLFDAPALADALARLHTPVEVPTRRLDADATVARSAGGCFSRSGACGALFLNS